MINLNVFMRQDFSTVRNIKIDYFKTLIFFLAAFNLVVFLAFVVHTICRLLLERRFRFALRKYKVQLNLRVSFRCPACNLSI